MKPVGFAAYEVVRAVLFYLALLYWRVDIRGKGNVPTSGPFLLCPVHRSNIDGPLTAIFTKRHMKYLAKHEMFRPAPFARLIESMGAISVNRGAPDRASLKTCLDVLNSGEPLVLFPEGGRRDGPLVEHVQEGAAYLALRSGVPIVPIGIDGSENANPRGTVFLRPVKVRVVIGKPLLFERPEGSNRVPRSVINESTATLQRTLQELFDEAAGRTTTATK